MSSHFLYERCLKGWAESRSCQSCAQFYAMLPGWSKLKAGQLKKGDMMRDLLLANRVGARANFYEILGVKKDATLEEIRKHTQNIRRDYHEDILDDTIEDALAPIRTRWDKDIDRLQEELGIYELTDLVRRGPIEQEISEKTELRNSELEAEEKLIRDYSASIETAYATLSDRTKRKQYDENLANMKKSDTTPYASFRLGGYRVVMSAKPPAPSAFAKYFPDMIHNADMSWRHLAPEMLQMAEGDTSEEAEAFRVGVREAVKAYHQAVDASFETLEARFQHEDVNLANFPQVGAKMVEQRRKFLAQEGFARLQDNLKNLTATYQQNRPHIDMALADRIQRAADSLKKRTDDRFDLIKAACLQQQTQTDMIQDALEACPKVAASMVEAIEKYKQGMPSSFTMCEGHVQCATKPPEKAGQFVMEILHKTKVADRLPTTEEIKDSFLVAMAQLKHEGFQEVVITSNDEATRQLAIQAALMAGYTSEQIRCKEWTLDTSWAANRDYNDTGQVQLTTRELSDRYDHAKFDAMSPQKQADVRPKMPRLMAVRAAESEIKQDATKSADSILEKIKEEQLEHEEQLRSEQGSTHSV